MSPIREVVSTLHIDCRPLLYHGQAQSTGVRTPSMTIAIAHGHCSLRISSQLTISNTIRGSFHPPRLLQIMPPRVKPLARIKPRFELWHTLETIHMTMTNIICTVDLLESAFICKQGHQSMQDHVVHPMISSKSGFYINHRPPNYAL